MFDDVVMDINLLGYALLTHPTLAKEWKSGNLYIVEFTAQPGTKVREGTVGDMWSTETEQRLPGGGHQVEFKDHPAANPEKFEIDKNSIREIR